MKRRDLLRRQLLFAGAICAILPAGVFAQARAPRIGMLGARPLADSTYVPGVVRRLAELGYRDGAGMVLEYRSSDGFAGRYPKQARELIDLKCDLIFAIGPEAPVRALQDARSPAPVVFLAVDYDPLEKGLVASLRRPDRNTTGVYVPQNALVAKRVEILREIMPNARRFLVLADTFSTDQVDAVRKAADAGGVQVTMVEFSGQPYDYAGVFETARRSEVDAFIGLASPVFGGDRAALSALLIKHRLPSVGVSLPMASAGFLVSFGVHVPKLTGRVAEIGVRILNGAKPSDIPVEQADEFELAINAKTAKALGVKIPESVLARATRIIS